MRRTKDIPVRISPRIQGLKGGVSWVALSFVCTLAIVLFAGCATHLSKPTKAPTPTLVRFSEFQMVEIKSVALGEKFAMAEANQRALRKIDEYLFRDMEMVFPGLVRVEPGQDFTKVNERTLQITPVVEEIKFINGGARFMVGPMAGSSAVLFQLTFRDSASGEIIADPEFYRVANAYAGGKSVGVTDNQMLENIARDAVQYTSFNK